MKESDIRKRLAAFDKRIKRLEYGTTFIEATAPDPLATVVILYMCQAFDPPPPAMVPVTSLGFAWVQVPPPKASK